MSIVFCYYRNFSIFDWKKNTYAGMYENKRNTENKDVNFFKHCPRAELSQVDIFFLLNFLPWEFLPI